MGSPSDDGQCTDTDKEEDAIDDEDHKSSGENSGVIVISPGMPTSSVVSSDNENNSIEMDKASSDQEDSSMPLSDAEDEEARLRQKLLEKRSAIGGSVATVSNDLVKEQRVITSKFDSLGDTNRDVNLKELTYHLSPKTKRQLPSTKSSVGGSGSSGGGSNTINRAGSDDEEMFSIQPKDLVVKTHRITSRHNEIKEREHEYRDKIRKNDRLKEERHRRKDRKHERRSNIDKAKRDVELREERRRHSTKHQLLREYNQLRPPGNDLFGEQKAAGSVNSESRHKDQEVVGKDSKNERVSRLKDPKRSRSPRRRELVCSPIRHSAKSEMPSKKINLEKIYDSKIEMTVMNTTAGDRIVVEKKITTVNVEETDTEILRLNAAEEQDASSAVPAKYSKFDSSPEDEERNVLNSPLSNEKIEVDSDFDSDSESDVVLRGMDDEHIDIIDELGEDDLAQLSPDTRFRLESEQQRRLIAKLPIYYPGISGCRNVAEFECLNRIEEGTFGVVYRAKEKKTDEVVALKRLKMEKEKEGFPITSLREINMLLKAGNHPNVVNVREIVIGSNMDKIYLVMEYVEHDMKSLMDTMHSRQKHFTIGQVKTLLHQLLCGVAHMHDEWILHRDLKTSNLLLSHKGILKIGDFGLSREFGDPLKAYTPIVVTLWYRSPELLLGVKEYSTEVDMWSCGCIFAEFLKLKPLFPGKGEVDQINKIFTELGTPNETTWPGFRDLPGPRKMKFDHHESGQLEKKFPPNVVDKKGLEFMKQLLSYNPSGRLSAHVALTNDWFQQHPLPTPPELFPTWPAKSELGKTAHNIKSPIAKRPSASDMQNEKLFRELKMEPKKEVSAGFALKFDAAPKFI